MVDARARNPADLMKYYLTLMNDKHAELQECLSIISDCAGKLKQIADDTQNRLLTRQ